MLTYTTLDGMVLDLSSLTTEEQAYFDRCISAYRAGLDFTEFFNRLLHGPENPLMRATGGVVTRTVWAHPLFQAVHDLADRLGILQDRVGAEPGDDPSRDPLTDEWVPTVEAARRKGVAFSGLHQAIQRGEVIAQPAKPNGKRLLVSANSLARWTPMAGRQQAGRRRAALASGARKA